mmetsp:Transcript_20749/g.29582  ORF Transcript_20749/g.29582 Transcript_20749/m.29582 type:complete len:226 (+) Transcript_20749:94-771(+)
MSAAKTYDDYFQEYNSALAKVRSFLACPAESSLSECEAWLQMARSCLTAMQGLSEIENDVVKLQATKQLFAREVTPLANEVRRVKDKAIILQKQQNSLFQGKKTQEYVPPVIIEGGGDEGDETQALLLASRDMLFESQALCVESEGIGQNVIRTMSSQRQQLEMSSARLQGTISNMDQARQVLKQIGQKALRNKIFLYVVIILLLFANAYALYRIFVGKSNARPN